MSQWIETHRGIVRPEDCDVNRHMNVKGYFDRFGIASGYLLKQAGLYYSDVVRLGYGVGAVSNTIRYRRELVDGDTYVIASAFVRLEPLELARGNRGEARRHATTPPRPGSSGGAEATR